MIKTNITLNILSILFIFNVVCAAESETTKNLDKIEVRAVQEEQEITVLILPEKAQSIIDTPDVLKKMAGTNVNRNGPLTGVAQYRGLSGNRVNVQIDGTTMQESCSNSMDAAMSHVPAGMVDAVILKRGIIPVSSGIETIGGNIVVMPKKIQGYSDELELSGQVSLGFTSVNSGKKASLFLSAESASHNFYFGANTENGDSFKFDDGKNYNTEYDRDFYLLGYNFTNETQKIEVSYNYNDTGLTGTPALPMDIVYAKGGVISLEHLYKFFDDWQLTSKFSHQNTDHLMSNSIFRNTLDRKESFTQVYSNSYSFVLDAVTTIGDLAIGIEGDSTSHQADITSSDNVQFHIKNFNTSKDRNSIFLELNSGITRDLKLVGGIRYTQVAMDAADVSSSVAMMDTTMGKMHRMLRDNFNSTDRKIADDNVDFSLNLSQKLNESVSIEYGLGYKVRSPSYQERYLWLPLESTAGLADGFRYLGNLQLKPEKAMQFELGMNFENEKLRFTPHVFYHQINDYIQGTATPNPNVLKFNNVDAELYGADLEFSYQLNEKLSFNNVTSYVKGKRRDIDDNLYRIAPLNSRFEMRYEINNWNLSSEFLVYQAQSAVSITNKEKKTPGYGLINLAGTYNFNQKTNLAFGINNVLDKKYANHLNGYNRNNLNSDVGFDSTNTRAFRLPGEGINVYATLYVRW